ncbi:hypothetical protein IWX90DRAFT_293895 [Phyllosticta citrichinensis]|uniref:Uncharacterized protein n=1 Tax=Phyllosticta citrichinensis TaxID=1130410 RepID=A0ABR1XK93_9PEZI
MDGTERLTVCAVFENNLLPSTTGIWLWHACIVTKNAPCRATGLAAEAPVGSILVSCSLLFTSSRPSSFMLFLDSSFCLTWQLQTCNNAFIFFSFRPSLPGQANSRSDKFRARSASSSTTLQRAPVTQHLLGPCIITRKKMPDGWGTVLAVGPQAPFALLELSGLCRHTLPCLAASGCLPDLASALQHSGPRPFTSMMYGCHCDAASSMLFFE